MDKVFRFGSMELCPTLEEYIRFLGIEETTYMKVVVPKVKTGYSREICQYLQLPKGANVVEGAIFNILNQVEADRTIVLVILAETLKSLYYCVRNRQGKLQGCLVLLQAWLREHLPHVSYYAHLRSTVGYPIEKHVVMRPPPSF